MARSNPSPSPRRSTAKSSYNVGMPDDKGGDSDRPVLNYHKEEKRAGVDGRIVVGGMAVAAALMLLIVWALTRLLK